MGEEGVSNILLSVTEDKRESFCSMLFGISCAVFALRQLQEPNIYDTKWLEISDKLLQGSAHLMGLLLWRIQKTETNSEKSEIFQKLNNAERDIEELKRIRKEDAKANDKVAGIYASKEQSWFLERKKLRQQIGALLNELRVIQAERDDTISELNDKLEEMESLLNSKEKVLEEEEGKRSEIEVKLEESEKALEELRENSKRKTQEHCSEIWKHKTAFIELVSNQRHLEAELGRALKQAEASKEELNSVLEQKEEAILMTHNLSLEIVKLRKDLDQKDKILSAMLRKLKLDSAEKQMLLKELKLSKTQRKQAELERAVSETQREKHSLKRMLSKHTSFKFRSHLEDEAHCGRSISVPSDFLLEYDQPEHQNELQVSSLLHDQCSHEESEELMFGPDVKHLESWVRSEAERYSIFVEQRHHLEVNAFSEQLRLKDEKLEGCRWRLLSMELGSKHLETRIEVLNHDITQLRQENMKLGTLILEKESEVNSLKRQLSLKRESQDLEMANLNLVSEKLASNPDTVWSNVTIVKRKPVEKEEEEIETTPEDISQKLKPQEEKETSSTSCLKDIVYNVKSPENDFEEEKEVILDPGSIRDIVEIVEKPSFENTPSKNTVLPWKMDINALSVSYKIKRLKQQLLMLERFIGKQKSCEYIDGDDGANVEVKGFHLLVQFLNKQVTRYQSLQEKVDELSERMHQSKLDSAPGDFKIAKSKNETKALSNYLEETFQLQRYIVASGQKLMELQSKIVPGFVKAAEGLDGPGSFDMKRCGESVGTIFKEVQRGLEVRIARIIGDVEGTLACDGIIHLKR